MRENLDFLKHYFIGKGLDTSKTPYSLLFNNQDVMHWYKEPNNLYHIFANDKQVKYHSYDFVFNRGLISQNKFFRILFKEWFWLLKVGGNLIVQFEPSKFINLENISEVITKLFRNGAELNFVYQGKEGFITAVIRKIDEVSQINESNDINKWSFGIIGETIEKKWMNDLMRSIEVQNIPQYEILLYFDNYIDALPENVICLSNNRKLRIKNSRFKKKEHICFKAKYQNILIFDSSAAKVVLDDNWFKGMKSYQNEFELLSCVIKGDNQERVNDWQTLGIPYDYQSNDFYTYRHQGLLDYIDWDPWLYFSDPFLIIKKNVMEETTWSKFDFDDDKERVIFCHELLKKGFLMRFNHLSACNLWGAKERLGKLPFYEFNDQKLGRRRISLSRRLFWLIDHCLDKVGVPYALKVTVIKYIKKTRFYLFLIQH